MANTITMPDFGEVGLDAKPIGLRFDFKQSDFHAAIETRGYRLAWSRAQSCPCEGINDQTKQVDPNCPLCKGKGWFYFGPKDYVVDEAKVGELTPLQKRLTQKENASIIRGVMSGLGQTVEAFDKLGTWVSGTSQVTVRHENRLGYYDRLVALDSEIVYSEVVTAVPAGQPLALRYPAISVNMARTLATDYRDFAITEDGKLLWNPGTGPQAGVKLAVHYNTFPFWIVIDHPNAYRDTYVTKKKKLTQTPTGDKVALPVKAIVRYDFLRESP